LYSLSRRTRTLSYGDAHDALTGLTRLIPYGDGFASLIAATRFESHGSGVGSLTRHTCISTNSEIVRITVRLDECGSTDLYVTSEILNVRRHIVL
jgi:hypothetical protein